MAALLLPAAWALAQTGKFAPLLEQLADDTDSQRRYQAYLALQRERSPALVPLLVEALPRMAHQSQSFGLSLLQGYPPEVEHPALRQLLRAKAPFLQLGAAAVLLRAGDRTLVDPITQALARTDVDSTTRTAMIYRLYGLTDAKIGAAVAALVTPAADANVLDAALGHLLQNEHPDAKPAAAALLAAPAAGADTRALAAAFLLAKGDGAQAPAIATALMAQGGSLLSRLQRYLLAASALPDSITNALAEIAANATLAYQVEIALGLLGKHASDQHLPMIRKLATHADAKIAKAALDALQKRGISMPAGALARMLAAKEPEVALNAADTLRKNDDLSGLPRVLELAKMQGTHQAEAMRVLGRFRTPQAVPALLDGLEATDLGVRSAAEQSLGMLLPSLFPYRRFDLQGTGYSAGAEANVRAEAVRKIRAWWDAHRPH